MSFQMLIWSLRHRRMRHLITGFTLLITASVVIVFVSVTSALLAFATAQSERELLRVFIQPKIAGGDLPMAMYTMLQKIDGVRAVQRWQGIGGRTPKGISYAVHGEDPATIEYSNDFIPIEPDVLDAWKKEAPTAAVVTEGTARDLNLKIGQQAEIATAAGAYKVKVVGFSHGGLVGQRIVTHFDYMNEFRGNPGTARFRVYVKPQDYERVAREIEERTKNSATPVAAVSAANLAASQVRRAAMVPAVLGFLGLFLIFTTALTLANTSAISVRERRIEMATLRMLGFHRRTILALLVGESLLVGLISAGLAIALVAFVFRGGIQLTPGEGQLLEPVKIGRDGLLAGLITSVVVPLIGALPSALGSIRIPLVKALRDSA